CAVAICSKAVAVLGHSLPCEGHQGRPFPVQISTIRKRHSCSEALPRTEACPPWWRKSANQQLLPRSGPHRGASTCRTPASRDREKRILRPAMTTSPHHERPKWWPARLLTRQTNLSPWPAIPRSGGEMPKNQKKCC